MTYLGFLPAPDVSPVTYRGAHQWASVAADGKTSGASGRTVTACGEGGLGRTQKQISFPAGIKAEIAVSQADGQKNERRATSYGGKKRAQAPILTVSLRDEAGDTLKLRHMVTCGLQSLHNNLSESSIKRVVSLIG